MKTKTFGVNWKRGYIPETAQGKAQHMKTSQTKHEESGCTDYLQHNADSCPIMAAARKLNKGETLNQFADRIIADGTPNKAQHSPLPWTLDDSDWPLIINEESELFPIVATIPLPKESTGIDADGQRAVGNAKLIVASVNHAAQLAGKLLDLANIATHPKATLEQRKTIAREAREAVVAYEAAQ